MTLWPHETALQGSQEIVRKVQQLKIEADLPTEDIDEWRDEQRSLLTKPGEDLQKIKRLMDESGVKEEKKTTNGTGIQRIRNAREDQTGANGI